MSRRLSIASVCRTFPTLEDPSSGIFVARRVAAMSRAADVRALQPVPYFPVLAPAIQPQRTGAARSGELEVEQRRMFYFPGVLKSLDPYWLARAVNDPLRRMHQSGQLDLIDAHFGYPEGVGCLRLGRHLGVPAFITIRGFEKEYAARPYIGPVMLNALKESAGVIAVSHSLKRFAVDHGVPANHVRVIHNAIDSATFRYRDPSEARRALGVPAEAQLVVSVGHLVPRKRHAVLIEAFARVAARHDRARLVIIGSQSADPAHARDLLTLIRTARLEERVTLAGNLHPSVVAHWLAAADVFALATIREGCCNAVLEALAVGVPVVTTPVGDNAEFVKPGTNGFLVPTDDSAALAEAIEGALTQSGLSRTAIAEALRHHVGSWDEVGQQVVAFFKESLQERSK